MGSIWLHGLKAFKVKCEDDERLYNDDNGVMTLIENMFFKTKDIYAFLYVIYGCIAVFPCCSQKRKQANQSQTGSSTYHTMVIINYISHHQSSSPVIIIVVDS